MNPERISQFFDARKENSRSMVLVTVFETQGSTYTKAGAYMIVDEAGNFCGMLSGGCLEGDLAERSKQVIRDAEPQIATYDLSADNELFGLGVGCEGTMRVLLQPLISDDSYAPFSSIRDVISGHSSARVALVVESSSPNVAAGSLILNSNGQNYTHGFSSSGQIDLNNIGLTKQDVDGHPCSILVFALSPTPNLLVLGAGMDCEPLVAIASELGWHCTVQDHRKEYIEDRNFCESVQRFNEPADEIHQVLDFSEFNLAMIMSHHLASDRSYLRQLAQSEIPYVGLLGPPHRRERLIGDLGDTGITLGLRLHGPAGIDLGGRGPGPISLSIIAEMQQHLSDRQDSLEA